MAGPLSSTIPPPVPPVPPPPVPPPPVPPPPVPPVPPVAVPPAAFAVFCSAVVTATPIPTRPFMPAAACPVTEQRNSYLPLFERVRVSVADCPCFRIGVFLPVQEFLAAPALATGFAQI